MQDKTKEKLLEHEIRLKRIEQSLGLLDTTEVEIPIKKVVSNPKQRGRQILLEKGILDLSDMSAESALLDKADKLYQQVGAERYDVITNHVAHKHKRGQLHNKYAYLNKAITKELNSSLEDKPTSKDKKKSLHK